MNRALISMANIALLLGPVMFRDFEVPSGVNFGGRQRLAMHRLPGGSRVIDALGRDDDEISFSGIFTGPDATLRARSLDDLRVAGVSLPLTWDVFFYSVLIHDFQANYCNGWWIPYRITCTVIQDEASAFLAPPMSLAALVQADVLTATAYAAATGIDLSSLQTMLDESDGTHRGTADYTEAQAGISTIQASLCSSAGTAESQLYAAQPADQVSASAGVANLLAATEAAGQLTALSSTAAYVNRISVNLTNAST